MSVGKYADIHGWIDNKDNIVDIYGLPAEPLSSDKQHQTIAVMHLLSVDRVWKHQLLE